MVPGLVDKTYKKKISIKMREWHLKRNYSMTLEDYDNMFEDQGGVCFICKQPESADEENDCYDAMAACPCDAIGDDGDNVKLSIKMEVREEN